MRKKTSIVDSCIKEVVRLLFLVLSKQKVGRGGMQYVVWKKKQTQGFYVVSPLGKKKNNYSTLAESSSLGYASDMSMLCSSLEGGSPLAGGNESD